MLATGHPPRPPWALRFRSDDLDEVRAFVGNVDTPRARVAKQQKALGFDFYRVMGKDVALGCGKVAAAQTVRGSVNQPVLHVTQPTGSVYRVGRRVSAPTNRASAVIVPPEWEFTRVSPPGTLFAIRIDQGALAAELEARRPSAGGNWSLGLDFLVLSEADKLRLLLAASEMAHATRPGVDPGQLAHAESRVGALMADLLLRESAASSAGNLSLARLLDLEAWIDANLSMPLSLGRLCQVAGVGARCLQKAFERRRGMSPMRFVTERRILAAFERLSRAGPEGSVTGIALDLGFGHLSRFAHMYRQVIGELPSQTLARRSPKDAKHATPCVSRPDSWKAAA